MANSLMNKVTSGLVALFSITLLVTSGGYKLAPFGLAIMSLLLIRKTYNVVRNKEINHIMIAFISFFAVTILSLLIYGGDTGQADMPSRALFAVTILLLLLKYPPKIAWLLPSIIIGSYITGMIALYFVIELHSRAFQGFDYMVIQSGNMAMSLGLFSSIIALHYYQTKTHKMALLALGGALFAIIASLLSGARGGWPFSLLILITILFTHRDLVSKKLQVIGLIIAISLIASCYPLIEKRINKSVSEVQTYMVQAHPKHSSAAARIEMWKSAIYSFIDKPLFGQGFEGIIISKQQQVDEGKISATILKYKRAHNNFLTEASTKGVIGLAALLFFFLLPLNFFRKNHKKAQTAQQKVINLLGMTHVLSVMGYCMTQNYINHHSGILHYIVYTSIFIAISFNLANQMKTETENIK